MRLFIALDFDEQILNLLAEKYYILKSNVHQKLKWVEPEKWHLTLKFLGNTNSNKISDIIEQMEKINYSNIPTSVKIQGLGAFPEKNQPKIIFANISTDNQNLNQLKLNLEDQLFEIGFDKDKRNFNPHLTLARSKKSTDLKQIFNDLKPYYDSDFINFKGKIEKITLYESKLSASGAEYIQLFSKKLQ